jgi:hypothetical protein
VEDNLGFGRGNMRHNGRNLLLEKRE